MNRGFAACLAFALLTGGCGHVASTAITPDPAFAALDTNHDGVVSLEESHMAQLAFQAADTNGDGVLDILEWQGAGDASGIVYQRQADQEQRRDEQEPHRTGSTLRGVN